MSFTNDQRATWAAHGLRAYATGKEGGDSLYDLPESVLTDLLTDLMHYAAQEDIDFDVCVARAVTHYREERAEPCPDDLLPALIAAAEDTAAVLCQRRAIAYDRCARRLEALIARAKGGGS